MSDVLPAPALEALQAYAAGRAGTRRTIEALGGRDYADLIIALAKTNLPFPRPSATARRTESLARARALLLPRLKRGD